MTWAHASLESVHGTIKVTWKKQKNDLVELQVLIPSNTMAEIIIPTLKQNSILESGAPLKQVIGLSSVEQITEGHKLMVGSGDYHFTFTMS